MFLSFPAHVGWEEEAADPSAWGCQGAEGEPGPAGMCCLRHPGQLPAGGQPDGLWALCQDEVCAHHWAAQARGQNQTGRWATQVSDGQSANRTEAVLLKELDTVFEIALDSGCVSPRCSWVLCPVEGDWDNKPRRQTTCLQPGLLYFLTFFQFTSPEVDCHRLTASRTPLWKMLLFSTNHFFCCFYFVFGFFSNLL